MKTSMTKVSAALALMAFSSVAMASISTTRHNLGAGGTAGNHVVAGGGATTEICVFCHTPHGGDTNVIVPLWNRVTTTASFQTYATLGTGTLDATEAAIGSISIACLSCHDGTQAMDVVLNAPGFGGATTNLTITGTSTWVDATQMSLAPLNGEFVYISTDLRNDHPISIQYGGGNLTTNAPTGVTKDPDFNAPATGTWNSKTVWWLDTGVTGIGTKQKSDLPLYTRLMGGADQPFVECGSCHDPHSNNTTFLRPAVGNANSTVCLTCHNK
ncbi:MAG: cytochrome c3 family protein [Nitrosomonadales bacterium]|nr:cytochrome c3 family protein [Nitrosomonadales bacterium]